jgi:transcriptional regulator with XRE-family HTH domain
MAVRTTDGRLGAMLRDWRRRRRLSQMDLALDCGISTRHLSFVETGRSRPSAEMILRLAERLDVPLRDRNSLLLAAGHAPVFAARDLDDPELAPVREAMGRILAGHEPYPALAVDRQWEVVAANAALDVLIGDAAPELLAPPVNALRLALHPQGMAPRVLNLAEWRTHLLERLERQIAATADPGLATLREELLTYPAPAGGGAGEAGDIVAPLRIRAIDGSDELTFISTIATFGTASDITVSELALESFFPADAATGDYLRARAAA